MMIAAVLVVVLVALQSVWSDRGCPPPENVAPCTCYHMSSVTNLKCENLDDTETLENVFTLSSGYRYKQVHLNNSVLQYLPVDLFDRVQVNALYLSNVTLVRLFDEPPQNLELLDTLHIENTNVFQGMTWDLLSDFIHLRILNIYYIPIESLNSEFSDSVTANLKQLSLYGTQTSYIAPGLLSKFVNLEKVAIDASELTSLDRKIFPRPFHVSVLHFNNNKLTSIPNDLFVDMPNLQTLGLRGNQIKTLPESAFRGSLSKLEYLFLEGNPIFCDCNIRWLIGNKPKELTGTCEAPELVQGTKLDKVEFQKLLCYDS